MSNAKVGKVESCSRVKDGNGRLSEIKSVYVDNSACVRIKGGESEQFRIDSGVRHGCIMSP